MVKVSAFLLALQTVACKMTLLWSRPKDILPGLNIPKIQGVRHTSNSSRIAALALFQNGSTYANFSRYLYLVPGKIKTRGSKHGTTLTAGAEIGRASLGGGSEQAWTMVTCSTLRTEH